MTNICHDEEPDYRSGEQELSLSLKNWFKSNNVWPFFPHQLTIGFVLELVNLWTKLHR